MSRFSLINFIIFSAFTLAPINSNIDVTSANFFINNNSRITASSYYIPANESKYVHHNASSNMILTMRAQFAKDEEEDNVVDYYGDDSDKKRLDYSIENYLTQSSVIFGLTKVANASEINRTCYRHLKHIQNGILRKEPWAIKVLDSSATKPSGFLFGQNYWFGSREGCQAVQNPVAITLQRRFPRVMHYSIVTEQAPFDMDYRVVYLHHQSPWQVEIKLMSERIIHIGLCLPSSCESHEVEKLTTDYIENRLLAENEIYDIHPEVIYIKDLKLKDSFYEKLSFKIIVGVLIFTVTIAFCALVQRQKIEDGETSDDEALDIMSERSLLEPLKNFIRCFDVQKNYETLFATKECSPNQIPILNGLRSVSAFWILIFHVSWFMYFTVNNKAFLLSYAEKLFFQYVSSAPLLVDAFFTISGFLQTYNFMRNTRQMDLIRQNNFIQNVKQFFKMLFHRYLRLAPLYLVIGGLVDIFYAYAGDVSIFHISEHRDQICSKYWWRGLIFVQNLFDHNEMCLNWTWSLACEMQYFVLATILLFIYAKHPKFIKNLTIGAFVGNIIWTYLVGLSTKFQFSFDSCFDTGTYIYINPIVRILPYIMGSAAGWFLLDRKFQFEISELHEKCFWNLAILTIFVCFYSTIKRDLSAAFTIALFIFGRFCFSLSICWMIIGSATGRGSWWSRILESKGFQHINRLSYAIYLLNPFIIALIFSLTNMSMHVDPILLCVLCSGFTLITYVASIVFSLAFEMPYCNLSQLILRRKNAASTIINTNSENKLKIS